MEYIYILLLTIWEILMCCISTVGERVKEGVISCKIETHDMVIYRINFHLTPYEFEMGEILAPGRPDKNVCPDARASSVTHAYGSHTRCSFSLAPTLSSLVRTPARPPSCAPAGNSAPAAPSPDPSSLFARARTGSQDADEHASSAWPQRTPSADPRLTMPWRLGRAPYDSLDIHRKHETLECNIRLKQMKHL
jgi:hypothetical protein